MESEIQPDKKTYAVVFALDSINGLQTARTLAKRGVPVIGITKEPKHPFSPDKGLRRDCYCIHAE
jgi:hypothetical protein